MNRPNQKKLREEFAQYSDLVEFYSVQQNKLVAEQDFEKAAEARDKKRAAEKKLAEIGAQLK